VTRLQIRRQTGVGLDTGELPGRQVLGLGRKTILLDMRDPARAASAGRRLEDLDRLSGRGCAKAECQTGNGHDGSYKGADRHNLLPPASNSIWRPPDDSASRRTVGTLASAPKLTGHAGGRWARFMDQLDELPLDVAQAASPISAFLHSGCPAAIEHPAACSRACSVVKARGLVE